MSVGIILTLLAAVAVIATAGYFRSRAHARRARLLRESIGHVDAKVVVDEASGTAACTVRGLEVAFRLTTRGSGSSAEAWTEADVDTVCSPMTLHIRSQTWWDERRVAKGSAVDVQVGHDEFDKAFLVEAAPVELVRRVLSDEVRKRVLAMQANEIETGTFGLRLAKRGWVEDAESIREYVDLAATIAEQAAAAIAEAVQAAAPAGAAAYRAEAASVDRRRWEAGKQNLDTLHAAEVENVQRIRAERQRSQRLLGISIAVAMVLGFLAWLFASMSR